CFLYLKKQKIKCAENDRSPSSNTMLTASQIKDATAAIRMERVRHNFLKLRPILRRLLQLEEQDKFDFVFKPAMPSASVADLLLLSNSANANNREEATAAAEDLAAPTAPDDYEDLRDRDIMYKRA